MKKTLLCTCLFAFVPLLPITADPEHRPTVLSSQNGRYAFGVTAPGYAMQYMLDTQTGRLWKYSLHEKEPRLVPVMFELTDGTQSLLPGDLAKEQEALKAGKAPRKETP